VPCVAAGEDNQVEAKDSEDSTAEVDANFEERFQNFSDPDIPR
jgi:hypothetical protein